MEFRVGVKCQWLSQKKQTYFYFAHTDQHRNYDWYRLPWDAPFFRASMPKSLCSALLAVHPWKVVIALDSLAWSYSHRISFVHETSDEGLEREYKQQQLTCNLLCAFGVLQNGICVPLISFYFMVFLVFSTKTSSRRDKRQCSIARSYRDVIRCATRSDLKRCHNARITVRCEAAKLHCSSNSLDFGCSFGIIVRWVQVQVLSFMGPNLTGEFEFDFFAFEPSTCIELRHILIPDCNVRANRVFWVEYTAVFVPPVTCSDPKYTQALHKPTHIKHDTP